VLGLYSMYGMYGIWSVWYVGVYNLRCEILVLLNMVDMDRWKTGVSNAEYLVRLVHMNRLRACRILWWT